MSQKKKNQEVRSNDRSDTSLSSETSAPEKTTTALGEPPIRFAFLMASTIGLFGWWCFLSYVAIKVVFGGN